MVRQQRWLEDHVRYRVLHDQHQQPWWNWPRPLAQHQSKALEDWVAEHQDALQRERLTQWQLDCQWQRIRAKAADLGILLFGDLPFYVSADSADVWSHRKLFTINGDGRLSTQSGVPPDYSRPGSSGIPVSLVAATG